MAKIKDFAEKHTKGFRQAVEETVNDDKRLFKIETIASSKYFLVPFILLVFLFVFNGLIYLCQFFTHLGGFAMSAEAQHKIFGIHQAFMFWHQPAWYVFIDFLFSAGMSVWLGWRIWNSYTDKNIGQKGVARWTTKTEIKEQYKEIPDGSGGDRDFYPGGGGVPVSRIGDKLYLDDSPVNNLIIGITRSGKGEMFVFPMIDIYSRAGLVIDKATHKPKTDTDGKPMIDMSKRSSLIVTDPKLELYANSFDTLKERGYNVMCLNLVEPIKSMGYNPLQLIIDAYKVENYDEAEMLANTFAYSIFMSSDGGGNDKFWSTESSNLLVAMILATIEDCLKEDQHVNVENLKLFREKQKRWDKLSEADRQSIRNRIAQIEKDADAAMKEANQHSVPNSPASQTAGQDLKQEMLDRFYMGTSDDERKEPSGIYGLEAIPPEVEFHPTNKYEKQITMYSIVNTMTELARLTDSEAHSALDRYFADRPVGDRGKLKYSAIEVAGDQTKGSIFASCLAELTIFTYNNIAKMTSKTAFDLKDIGFGDKPYAIFLGIPDYDQSNHFIASVFIRQLYFTLAKGATMTKSGKCKREVIFLLDEFGNLPAIEGMESIITVCLGRNIRFDLVIQSYSQVEKLYKEGSKTIIGNCGNQIYILTNDKNTAEEYSALVGSKTIKTVSASGQRLNTNKSFTESYEERALLNANELMELKNGECVVKRVMKREDKEHNKITPTAIFNHDDTAFKFRWQYLQTNDPTNYTDLHARDPDVVQHYFYKDDGKTLIPGHKWLFPSNKVVDDIDYDKMVENTKMEQITFDIYKFCSTEMKGFIDDEANGGKDKQKFDALVTKSNGTEYAERHDAVNYIPNHRIDGLPGDTQTKVYEQMKPFLPGVQEYDPVFQAYSFEDCMWKVYRAYDSKRKKQTDSEEPAKDGESKHDYGQKFDELSNIFKMADSDTRKKILENLAAVRSMMQSANATAIASVLHKQEDADMHAFAESENVGSDEEDPTMEGEM